MQKYLELGPEIEEMILDDQEQESENQDVDTEQDILDNQEKLSEAEQKTGLGPPEVKSLTD